MARALRLARRGLYSARPNPRVGCVLVNEGRIVGKGFHAQTGEAHAEINALQQAGLAAAGATAYVSLEPCCHHGRTPVVTTGFQADVSRGTRGGQACLLQRVDFRMGLTGLSVEPLTDDAALVDQHASHPGIGTRAIKATTREPQGARHEMIIERSGQCGSDLRQVLLVFVTRKARTRIEAFSRL